jgi:hypothetical protein
MTREEFRTQKALGLLTVYRLEIRATTQSDDVDVRLGCREIREILSRHCLVFHPREEYYGGVINKKSSWYEAHATYLVETTEQELDAVYAEMDTHHHVRSLSFKAEKPIMRTP